MDPVLLNIPVSSGTVQVKSRDAGLHLMSGRRRQNQEVS